MNKESELEGFYKAYKRHLEGHIRVNTAKGLPTDPEDLVIPADEDISKQRRALNRETLTFNLEAEAIERATEEKP